MIDITTLLNNDVINVAPTVIYLSDLLAKGVFAGIGKDIWEKVKSKAVNNTDKKAVESFEKNPNEGKNIGKMELLLDSWIENDIDFKLNLTELIKKINVPEVISKTSIHNSKNIVTESSINLNTGNIQIGDNLLQ